MNLRINRFINRYATGAMWAAGVCTLAGVALHHLTPYGALAPVFFVLGTILAGFPIAFRAWSGLRFKTVGIELLVTIAVVGALFIGEFSEAGIVTFLFQFGAWLEQKTMKKTRSAIAELVAMAPVTAWRIDGDELEEIDADEVEEGDLLLVKTGAQIPADGVVAEGEGHVNEASITGEPLPGRKVPGDGVFAGTVLESGTLKLRATKVGEDTTFARIIALVEEAQDAKSPAERFIDRFARYYTPAVVVMAALVLVIFKNLDTAITVLVLACPGALVIGAPIANVAGIGRGAREGVLLKGGDSVHTFVKTDVVLFDKTGTLTEGYPEVVGVFCEGMEESEAVALSASAEQASDHPLAQAVVAYARERGCTLAKPGTVETVKGMGLRAEIGGRTLLLGSLRLMEGSGVALSAPMRGAIDACANEGSSLVLAAVDGRAVLLYRIRDALKRDAKESLRALRGLGVRKLIMLTGDHAASARAVGEELGLDEVYAELLPQDKLEKLQELRQAGHVVTFVGDGVNDSPALTAADTGIAMGSGTDVAIDCSDVVLIRSSLTSAVEALRISKATVRILYENIFIAVATVVFLLIGLFAGYVHMAVGMLVHEASILVVILNAMRLLIQKRTEG